MEFCSNCGQPLNPMTGSCPVCGGNKTQDLSDEFIATLKCKLRSPLMLIFTIVLTACAIYSMVAAKEILPDVFGLLIPICLWITYFSACASGSMKTFGIKIISIIIAIERFFIWVAVGILTLFAIIVFSAPSVLNDTIASLALLFDEYSFLTNSASELSSSVALFIGILSLCSAIIAAVLNITYFGSISKSVKSVTESFKLGRNCLKKFKAVTVWNIIFGIVSVYLGIRFLNYSLIFSSVTLFLGAFFANSISKISSK